jgi:hypothetical protein
VKSEKEDAAAVSPSRGLIAPERFQTTDFDGGPLDFIYAHAGERCRVDVGHLLDTLALPSAADVTELLSYPLLPPQVIRVVTEGEAQALGTYSRPAAYNRKTVPDSLDSLALRRALAAGSTIVFEDVGRWHLPIARICNTIFNDRWLFANADYFMTRAGNQGLPFHADEETTFVFQVAGTKKWQVADYPADRRGSSEVPPRARVFEFVLQPGDVACVPPRYPHRTVAIGGGDSIHLALGVRGFKLKDFIFDLAERGISRVPPLDEEINSIEMSLAPLLEAAEGPSGQMWRQEIAIGSIRLASGLADRGFEISCLDEDYLRRRRAPVLGDLVWRVRLGNRWLVHLSSTFAVMDEASADALCAAVAARNFRGCRWQELAAEGGLPPAVRHFLESAGWVLDCDGQP